VKAYAFDLEGFAARHLGGNVEKLADQVSSNHRTKSCQIAEQNYVKSPNAIDWCMQEMVEYEA
jgi:hypothetical protein